MTREEMINEVVKEYFRGGNWQARLKELVREVKKDENNSNNINYMCNDLGNHISGIQ